MVANPIEEKPQKADLREQVKAMRDEKFKIDPWFVNSKYSDGWVSACDWFLALIDADSKAREEEKKRLADDLIKLEQAIGVLIRMSEGDKATIKLDYLVGWDNLLLKHIAELTASKQDSEGTS